MYYGKNNHTFKFATILAICIGLVSLVSCSPHRRLSRLLRNHPYLVETQIRDSVVVREGKVVDTTLLIKETRDTIQLSSGTTIIRNSDTFRFITRIEPCTTFITKRETIFPKEQRKEKAEERQFWEILQVIALIFLCVLLGLSLIIRRI